MPNLFNILNRLYDFPFSISNIFVAKPFKILNRWHDLEEECCEFEQFGANH